MTVIYGPISCHIWLEYMSLKNYLWTQILFKLSFFRKTGEAILIGYLCHGYKRYPLA